MTPVSESTRMGTPISTTSPRTTEPDRRITATTTYATAAPARRAVLSKAPPARSASFVTSRPPRRSTAATDGGPGARRVVAHDLDQAERRHQPVLHGVAVAHDAREPLDDPERQQDERPEGERMPVVVDDPVLDGASDRERHQRLGEHPGDPERDPDRERADLAATDPDEEALRRPGVGDARVDQRKVAHPEGRVRSRPFAHGRTRGL